MLYYILISMPFIFFLSHILLTNILIPHFKKKALYHQLRTRRDWPILEKTENILKKIFKGVHGKATSRTYRLSHFIKNKEFIYGEIEYLTFYTILEKAQLSKGEVFYDLGSGSGKAVFTAGLFFNPYKSCGIELLPPLHKKAKHRLKNAIHLFQNPTTPIENRFCKRIDTILFINDNFLNYDFNDANVLYIAATCLSDSTWEQLIKRIAQLKSGSRIIVATKKIPHDSFVLVYEGIELMSWGLCPVRIYKISKNELNTTK